jgi:hypothetical protein
MAISNFLVRNGFEVGDLKINSRGNLTTTGSITGTTGATGAAALQNLTAVFPGAISTVVGTQRMYPRANIAISSVTAWVNSNPTQTVTAAIRKNGISVQTIVIPTSTNKISTPVTILATPDDYLTVDIVSGTGSNLTIRLEY